MVRAKARIRAREYSVYTQLEVYIRSQLVSVHHFRQRHTSLVFHTKPTFLQGITV